MNAVAHDRFDNPVTPPLLVRLDRHVDRDRPCCNNVAIVGSGKAQHAAALYCAGCNAHRGWLRREALDFLTDLARRFGAPAEPIILRDSSIGEHVMADKQFDNSGILFRNDDKTKDSDRDYKGEATISGVKYWISGWIKQGKRGKFLSFSFKPKDASAAAKPKSASAFDDDMNDKIGF
jgi:hypothetical protein